jgi:AhpD family alkylhydroperoxidase
MESNRSKDMNRPSQQASSRQQLSWPEVQKTLDDIQETFGFVPEFVDFVTRQALPGAWEDVKNVYFNPNTALDPKLKDLIGLAVASQIPCAKCTYFSQIGAEAHQATEQEQSEAVLMSAITRHWSTVLNGSMMEKEAFRKEADQIMAFAKKMMEGFRANMPPQEMFLVHFNSASEAYKDIEQTLGLVPKFFTLFPEEGIAGAWSEFKGLQLNPYTALNGKQKELIGLSVAAQIPCEYCIYFHRSAAYLNGATDREINEAIANAALTRHWSAILNGAQIELEKFKSDADRMLKAGQRQQLHS